MEITEVRIFPRESKDKKLKAYATVTFDDSFVVRDMKVIQGNKGYFVAMPSRRLKESCPKCGHRNVIRSEYCNQCGSSLPMEDEPQSKEQRQKEHRDIAHPINSEFRDYLQKVVMENYEKEAGAELAEEQQQESQEPKEEPESPEAEEQTKSEQQLPDSEEEIPEDLKESDSSEEEKPNNL